MKQPCQTWELNYNPVLLGDTVGLRASLLGRISSRQPNLDMDECLALVDTTVQSLGFLAGAQADGFITGIDAALNAGGYELRVIL